MKEPPTTLGFSLHAWPNSSANTGGPHESKAPFPLPSHLNKTNFTSNRSFRTLLIRSSSFLKLQVYIWGGYFSKMNPRYMVRGPGHAPPGRGLPIPVKCPAPLPLAGPHSHHQPTSHLHPHSRWSLLSVRNPSESESIFLMMVRSLFCCSSWSSFTYSSTSSFGLGLGGGKRSERGEGPELLINEMR